MKNILNTISLIILISATACSDSNEASKQDVTTKMLTASSWGHATVTHSDGDLSDQYSDFIIVFTSNASNGYDGTFVVANGGHAFSETSGSWKFNDGKTQIILNSGKQIDFTFSGDSLELDFTVADTGGKTAGISGHFIFELQPM